MKRVFILLSMVLFEIVCFAQKPNWVSNLPKAENATYHYVVARGYGMDFQEARNNAIQDLNRQLMETVGEGKVTTNNNGEVYYQTIEGQTFSIKIRRVCSWPDNSSDFDKEVCLLYQVANIAGDESYVHFTDFEGCNVYSNPFDGVALAKSALLPGLGQLHRGQSAKGIIFLSGEVVCVTGIVISHSKRYSFINKMNSTNNISQKKYYADQANTYTTVRNISIGAAVALYVWNLVDVAISKGDKRYEVARFSLTPTITDESVALSLGINF